MFHEWDLTTKRFFNMDSETIGKRFVKFDSTINLGHVLTFVGFILTGFGAWSSIDRRLTVLEESRRVQAQIDQNQDERVNQAMGQIKESLGDIRRNLEKVSDRLDKR